MIRQVRKIDFLDFDFSFSLICDCPRCGSCYRLRSCNDAYKWLLDVRPKMVNFMILGLMISLATLAYCMMPSNLFFFMILMADAFSLLKIVFGSDNLSMHRLMTFFLIWTNFSMMERKVLIMVLHGLSSLFYLLAYKIIMLAAMEGSTPLAYLYCHVPSTRVPSTSEPLESTVAATSRHGTRKQRSELSGANSSEPRPAERPQILPFTDTPQAQLAAAGPPSSCHHSSKCVSECVCCLEAMATFVADGCGHLVSCADCRRRLVYKELRSRGASGLPPMRNLKGRWLQETEVECPVCRAQGVLLARRSFEGMIYLP